LLYEGELRGWRTAAMATTSHVANQMYQPHRIEKIWFNYDPTR
jgi:hypothetical protein